MEVTYIMNPGILLLLLLSRQNKSITSHQVPPLQFDHILNQLQTTVSTLEKVNKLTQLGSLGNILGGGPASLPAPLPEPISHDSYESHEEHKSHDSSNSSNSCFDIQALANQLSGVDLESAMKTIGPLLSMFGGDKNSR